MPEETKPELVEFEFYPDPDVAAALTNMLNPTEYALRALKAELQEEKKAAEPKFGEWVDVSRRLPTEFENVLVYLGSFVSSGDFSYQIAFTYAGVWKNSTSYIPLTQKPTHWMPLPQDPVYPV